MPTHIRRLSHLPCKPVSGRRLAIGALLAALVLTACPSDPEPESDAAADIVADAEVDAIAGDAQPDDGGAVPDSDASAPDGDASVPDGDASTPDGDASAPDGDATAPDGDASAPDGDAAAPDGDASAPDGDASNPDGDASAPNDTTSAPDDSSTAPDDTAAPDEGPDVSTGPCQPPAVTVSPDDQPCAGSPSPPGNVTNFGGLSLAATNELCFGFTCTQCSGGFANVAGAYKLYLGQDLSQPDATFQYETITFDGNAFTWEVWGDDGVTGLALATATGYFFCADPAELQAGGYSSSQANFFNTIMVFETISATGPQFVEAGETRPCSISYDVSGDPNDLIVNCKTQWDAGGSTQKPFCKIGATVDGDVCPDPNPVPSDPLAALSDEFDDALSLDDWTIRWEAEGGPGPMGSFDVAQTTGGRMTIDPIAPPARGWFQDDKGPYIYKEISGDFVAWTHIRVGTPADINAAPEGEFAAGGFVIRPPGSSSPGNEAWMMHNIGRQAIPAFPTASEVKSTFPGANGSRSSLFLTDVGGLQGQLAVCRLGSQFYFFHRIDGVDADWVQETHDASNIWLDNANLAPNFDDGFNRPDMPSTLQVGIMVNSDFNQVAPAPRVDVDYVRFATPSSFADCTGLAQ